MLVCDRCEGRDGGVKLIRVVVETPADGGSQYPTAVYKTGCDLCSNCVAQLEREIKEFLCPLPKPAPK